MKGHTDAASRHMQYYGPLGSSPASKALVGLDVVATPILLCEDVAFRAGVPHCCERAGIHEALHGPALPDGFQDMADVREAAIIDLLRRFLVGPRPTHDRTNMDDARAVAERRIVASRYAQVCFKEFNTAW
eukprot:CAMPEP_0180640090 /NCGR_PEP_ID=MMETSP1037_2-20121125/45505_1 /TAXON_ID=632150 /ORGANISM="Azadinium spinosum, Strain 3D9" /LENGTH=130 /DNA_ID=CAMNT_0022662327 /DNA_START=51 /DNA_END=444 /DNA_ORIENTATION=-